MGYQYTLYFPHKIPIYLKIVQCVILNNLKIILKQNTRYLEMNKTDLSRRETSCSLSSFASFVADQHPWSSNLRHLVPQSSFSVLFLFLCIPVFSTFCDSDFFDLSPCRSSFLSFKALRSCFTVIFSGFRKYSLVRSQQAIRFSPSSSIKRRPSLKAMPTGLFKPETTSVTSTG